MKESNDGWDARVLRHVLAEPRDADEHWGDAQDDPARKAEVAWLDTLAGYVERDATPSRGTETMIERALAAADEPPVARLNARRSWRVAGLCAIAAVAASLAWVWLRPSPRSTEDTHPWTIDVAPHTVARLGGDLLTGAQPLPPGGRLEVEAGEACIRVHDAHICARGGSSLSRVATSPIDASFAGWSGDVSVTWGDQAATVVTLGELSLTSDARPAEVRLDSREEHGVPQATVLRGVVQLAVAGQTWTVIEGESLTLRPPANEAPHPSVEAEPQSGAPAIVPPSDSVIVPPRADELLLSAQSHRRAGRFAAAARAYRELTRHHPSSEAAKVGRVAWADLQLDKLGEPRGAIRNYTQYLRQGGGPLEYEVRTNLARAYREVGDAEGERATLEVLLREAKGTRARELRRRLAELQ